MKSTSTCSCGSAIPNRPGGIGPRTVMIWPTYRSLLLAGSRRIVVRRPLLDPGVQAHPAEAPRRPRRLAPIIEVSQHLLRVVAVDIGSDRTRVQKPIAIPIESGGVRQGANITPPGTPDDT